MADLVLVALSDAVNPEQPARIRWRPEPLGHGEVMDRRLVAVNRAPNSDFVPSLISFPS
ncbi:protein of unknown function [Modestobacter italicus]|uniref:Uncharacterized protein n=1 Tax=Modestobacter italicus (strain DSM 44449 / CECT 9708 / BC 501) TaxID=2732864 RepID=I4F4L1_MODI5|nr:protein of unknown function [Modestobacter marinus]